MFYITYFQAILQPSKALLICALRGVGLGIPLAYVLPHIGGIAGLWLAIPVAETITLLIALLLDKQNRMKKTV